MGRLSGPELTPAGGTPYRAGDRVVTLAPGERGQTLTSECGTVVAVDVGRNQLALRLDHDGRTVALGGDELDARHLAHGYALTVHRAQGATVGRDHVLEDGGGRELAYVKLSRAWERSTLYVVADNLDQAAEDLVRAWSTSRRLQWAIDTAVPAPGAGEREHRPKTDPQLSAALRHGRLVAERDAIVAAVPPDWRDQVMANLHHLLTVRDRREDLVRGTGRYEHTPAGEAARERAEARRHREWAEHMAASPSTPRRQRRSFRHEAEVWSGREVAANARWERLAGPELARLSTEEHALRTADDGLRDAVQHRSDWLEQHPEAAARVARLESEIERLDPIVNPGVARDLGRTLPMRGPERVLEIEGPVLEL
jgi:hypothetical protein